MTSQTSPLCRRSPWLRSAAALALATAVTVPAALLAQGTPQAAAPGDSGQITWPANTRVIQAKMAKIAPLDGRAPTDFPLPQLRVYDKQGRRVLERLGFYAPTFSSFLTRALSGGSQADASRLLAHELDLVLAPDGKTLSTVPEADYTIVDYWASWCLPCRAQDRDLVKVLTAKPGVRVNLLKVEADVSQKTPQEIMKMIEAGRESVAARKKPQG
jgi:thiol-disulfide isomerase/thioredoxin